MTLWRDVLNGQWERSESAPKPSARAPNPQMHRRATYIGIGIVGRKTEWETVKPPRPREIEPVEVDDDVTNGWRGIVGRMSLGMAWKLRMKTKLI